MAHRGDIRKDTSLLNQYYLLEGKDSESARRALEIIIKKDPENKFAIEELARWHLRHGNTNGALKWYQIANQNDPNNYQLALELGKLYWTTGNNTKASSIFQMIANSAKEPLASQAREILKKVPTTDSPLIQAAMKAAAQTAIQPQEIAYIEPIFTQSIESPLEDAAKKNITTQTKSSEKTIDLSISEINPIAWVSTIFYSTGRPLDTTEKPAMLASTISARDQMLNKFYDLKKLNDPAAWEIIRVGAINYPNDIDIQKEAGYYALLTLKNDKLALGYFRHVYDLTKDPKIALQVAYIYDSLKQPKMAYHYFDLATNTTNTEDRIAAEIAKTNLRGIQTKFLPYPYEASISYSPLYMSRFKLLIHPVIAHLGLTVNQPYNWKVYLSYRRTSDDRSNTNNQVSSIFEDNAAITAIGTSLTPIKSIPQLVVFSELGKAVDLVYRNRSRWRTDFRGGAAYYNEWGFKPDYTLKPKLMLQPIADVYADAIYFTRYIDTIGTCRFRPGFKVFRWGTTSIDLYYRMFMIEDTARQFYNNIFEQGPGAALRFSDRYNIVLRYEQDHGRYLPAGSPSPNPYSQHYYNGVTSLETYFEF